MGWFSWFTDLFQYLGLTLKPRCVVFLGLDESGKTTLFQTLTEQINLPRSTMKPNKAELQIDGLKLRLIDLGGHPNSRRQRAMLNFINIDGIVFFVDAAAPERFAEAKAELGLLLQTEELADIPILLLGNKIDRPNAALEEDLKQALGITNCVTGKEKKTSKECRVRPMEMFMCSVIQKVGYGDGFRWLCGRLQRT